jgi:hypothetical protein
VVGAFAIGCEGSAELWAQVRANRTGKNAHANSS